MKIRKQMFHFQDKYPVDEIEKTIDGQTYYLVPSAAVETYQYYDIKHRYEELNRISKAQCTRKDKIQLTDFNRDLHCHVKSLLPEDICQMLIKQAQDDQAAFTHPDFINSMLKLILTEDIDRQLLSYFGSEYCLTSFSYLESRLDEQTPPYADDWHCDGGPKQHVKILLYLNDQKEHQGNTLFLSQTTTNRLKKQGLFFGNVKLRAADIRPLCKEAGIEYQELGYDNIKAGDGLLFNPCLIGHKRHKPKLANRHVLQLCFIPSPYHWEYTSQKIFPISPTYKGLEGGAELLLDYLQQNDQKVIQTIKFPASQQITSTAQLKLLLNNIFAGDPFADTIYQRFIQADPHLQQLNTLGALIESLKISFQHSINWQGELGIDNVDNLIRLAKFEREFNDSIRRYMPVDKPDPNAIFWPSPTHPTKPLSKYDMLPFVKKEPIMDMNTPIGSAGSCFAFEIARVFQQQGFNYIVTERNDDPNSGIYVDGYQPGDQYARFCANYGILFNTPSFRQLAERAFEIKPTPHLLFEQSENNWLDPYRENVVFACEEAYFHDYNRHIQATRNALEQTEVFIITLGLNECWEFRDGSVMSRNPRDNIYPLVRHKTLTVQENVDNIQTFYDIVKQHNPDFKLIISVSPIPFLATGHAKEQHIISANSHSKAVLRVAAQQLVDQNPDMYYLPSYEMVNECIKQPWGPDHRHVTPEAVEQVVELFKAVFVK